VTFQLEIVQHIHGNLSAVSSEDRWMHKFVQLPFPPTLGMQFQWRNDEGDKASSGPLTELVFDTERREFRAYVESNKERYAVDLSDSRDIQEIVDGYVDDGWTERR